MKLTSHQTLQRNTLTSLSLSVPCSNHSIAYHGILNWYWPDSVLLAQFPLRSLEVDREPQRSNHVDRFSVLLHIMELFFSSIPCHRNDIAEDPLLYWTNLNESINGIVQFMKSPVTWTAIRCSNSTYDIWRPTMYQSNKTEQFSTFSYKFFKILF